MQIEKTEIPAFAEEVLEIKKDKEKKKKKVSRETASFDKASFSEELQPQQKFLF